MGRYNAPGGFYKGGGNSKMTVKETPVEIENAAPIFNPVSIPEAARPLCDTWGNFKNPLKAIEENHGLNFIKIFIYGYDTRFYYGYQLKLDKMIREKKANITERGENTEERARKAARNELINLTTETKLRKMFICFDRICYNQPELF
jgi:hypothetical protein